jgi:hypothetical protein
MLHSPSSRLKSGRDHRPDTKATCRVEMHRVSDRPFHLAEGSCTEQAESLRKEREKQLG